MALSFTDLAPAERPARAVARWRSAACANFRPDFSAEELDELASLLRRLHIANAPIRTIRAWWDAYGPALVLSDEPVSSDGTPEISRRSSADTLPACLPLSLGIRCSAWRDSRYSFRVAGRCDSAGKDFTSATRIRRAGSAPRSTSRCPQPRNWASFPQAWITFGTPPPELGLALDSYQQIEPKRGRLVLFPSTMWHSTAPFVDGERLVVAFDVGIPRTSR